MISNEMPGFNFDLGETADLLRGSISAFTFNEIAPRPHNSFHWTIEGCKKSQFDVLVKSIIGKDIKDQSIGRKWKMIKLN